ncbi:MAG TPA: hypothetical protein VKA89_12225 [Solirubrobacterales bacterium]|nr:hypothetical protein [Solirubrobacterales bacterium]
MRPVLATPPATSPAASPRPALVVLAALAALATLALGLVLLPGSADAGARTTVVLGKSNDPPDPSCPENTQMDPCQAVGSVTGFQLRTDQETLPYRVPFGRGRIVAWSISLSQPTPGQRNFFNTLFGPPPEARIGVLKRVPKSSPPRYRLLRQSSIRVLSAFLGKTVRFRLGRPLPVRRGNIVALTVPTWVPAFAAGIDHRNAWRASREKGECAGQVNQRQGRPHQVVGSRRNYGCRYEGSRLLYTATVVQG